MKTPFQTCQTWKKHLGNLTFSRFVHLTKCSKHVEKNTFSRLWLGKSRTASKIREKQQTYKEIPEKLESIKRLNCYQNTDVSLCRNVTTEHIPDVQILSSQPSLLNCKKKPLRYFHHTLNSSFCTSENFNPSEAKYEPCYIFKYIVHTRVLSRMKIYQTLITIFAIPPTVYLHSLGNISTVDMYAMFGITSLACVMLYIMSLYFRRVVGMISVSKETSHVRLSHLTFWGKRKDVYLSPDDLIPLMDMSESAKRFYSIIRTYSSDQTFIIFLNQYKVLDKKQLEYILGPLE